MNKRRPVRHGQGTRGMTRGTTRLRLLVQTIGGSTSVEDSTSGFGTSGEVAGGDPGKRRVRDSSRTHGGGGIGEGVDGTNDRGSRVGLRPDTKEQQGFVGPVSTRVLTSHTHRYARVRHWCATRPRPGCVSDVGAPTDSGSPRPVVAVTALASVSRGPTAGPDAPLSRPSPSPPRPLLLPSFLLPPLLPVPLVSPLPPPRRPAHGWRGVSPEKQRGGGGGPLPAPGARQRVTPRSLWRGGGLASPQPQTLFTRGRATSGLSV